MFAYLSILEAVLPKGYLRVWLFYFCISQHLADGFTVALFCFVIGQSGYSKSCNQYVERLTKYTKLTLAVRRVSQHPVFLKALVNQVFSNF